MKWAYRLTTFTRGDLLLDELNKLGEQGWEAVSTLSDGHILLKRQKTKRR